MAKGLASSSGMARQPLPWALRFMLAASVVVPLVFLAVGASYRRGQMLEQAQADADRLSAVAREHALKVLETNALVLDRLEDRVRGMDWAEIAARSEELHGWMRRLDEEIAQIIALHIVKPNGDAVLLSLAWPAPPLNLTSRGYFRAMVAGERGIVIGDPFISPLTGKMSVVFGRAMHTAGGEFGGAVLGALLADYFEAQWRQMDPTGRASFGLVRAADGLTLASLPASTSAPGAVPDPGRVFAALQLAGGEVPSTARFGERDEWLGAGSRLGSFPLAVTVVIDLDRVRAEWLRAVGSHIAFILLAIAALGSVSLMAISRWRSEQMVLAELEAEIYRREEAEAGLRQAQRLEAVGQLTGGVAHDFNNLLTAILGTVQLLDRHLGAAADERTRKLLNLARDAVRRGATLNHSLLAFARRQSLKPADLEVNALLEGFAPLVQQALGEAVTLELALGAGLPWCRVDASQLESAILNLAINARDAMPRGGSLRLETRAVQLDAARLVGNPDARPGAFVAIALRDTGTGMLPEVRDRAFEPFFSTKPVGQGTGLGLSQVFGFFRQLGGHVTIDSTVGLGTTVTLFLPVAARGVQQAPAAPMEAQGLPMVAPAKILLVEDDARVREVTAELLREAGFVVAAAADGMQAMALLRRGEPADLLFTDIVMPGGMTGMELAQAARRLRPALPVLLATGYPGQCSDSERHGFEVLAKPYDQALLVRRLAELTAKAERVVA
jgi:signal transduction histidine kinase/ActR/RegA family two-component response regulator